MSCSAHSLLGQTELPNHQAIDDLTSYFILSHCWGGVKERRYNAWPVITDLAGEPNLFPEHISEAVQYRTLDRQFLKLRDVT